jgi:hypothetical protein
MKGRRKLKTVALSSRILVYLSRAGELLTQLERWLFRVLFWQSFWHMLLTRRGVAA